MIADSSAWIEYLRASGSTAHRRLRQALAREEPILMLDVVYQEVLQGAVNPLDFIRLQAAQLYAACRWQGITPRSSNDCLIAACAIESGEPLLHADRDFERIAGIEPRLRFV